MPHRLRFAAPDAAALIDWPPEFGRRFLVSVDVEEEFDWRAPFSARAATVDAIVALPATHARFLAHGVTPLYLVDYPVATDARAIDLLGVMLGDAGTAIGTQLHPWVNPPHEGALTDVASFAGNLPPALEAAKLGVLTEAITAAFGRPLAYRAGRYGLGPETIALLAAQGYRIDTSMRARHDYRRAGGADFTAIGAAAFRIAPGLIELPLTTIHTGVLRSVGPALHPALGRMPLARGIAARLGLLSRVPLTPEGTPVAEAIAAVQVAAEQGEGLLNLSFHSPSLVPGNTPYVRTASDRAVFDAWWERVFAELSRCGYAPVSLNAILAAA